MTAGPGESANVAGALADVSERIGVLVRDEIELAKAEVTQKLVKLLKGVVIAVAAGIFVVIALLWLLQGLSWLAWLEISPGHPYYYIGFFVVGFALLALGALAGYLAARAVRAGSPPVPRMAIDEARKIREAVSAVDGDATRGL